MKLADLILQFKNQQPGTDSYESLRAACLELASEDSAYATAYYLIYGFARSYVMLYEEEAVTFDVANKVKAQMLKYLERIEAAQNSSADEKLAALNFITTDYLNSSKIF